MEHKNDYLAHYTELDIIGRGNFGSATLVRNIHDNRLYVAKKIIMNYLQPREKESSLLEASLLKELKHPNIVQYQDSFMDKDMLIIIMEYCEEGDLGFHIKRMEQKKESIPEKSILNWFLQIALALDYIHQKKILHRDIKTSNIFLTSNGTVKIGDFGISKVLEGTVEAANTIVGTPYYMSPEVCENRPYTYKSDVWALGCVLYELCTLKHAFAANNLLGLVYKIVKDKYDPIPSIYSKELSNIVQKLLNKNEKERPTIREILRDPFMVSIMNDFVATKGGAAHDISIPIKKTAVHKEMVKHQREEEEEQPRENPNETPGQKMRRKKEEEARRQLEQMKQAARENMSVLQHAKQRKLEELQGSSPGKKSDIVKKTPPSQLIAPQQVQQSQYPPQTFENNGSQFTLKSTIRSKMEETDFIGDTLVSMNLDATEKSLYLKTNQFEKPDKSDTFQDVSIPTKPNLKISTTGNLSVMGKNAPFEETKQAAPIMEDIRPEEEYEEYYSDDFEDEEDENARLTKRAGETEMKEVLEVYKTAIKKADEQPNTPTTPSESQISTNASSVKEQQKKRDERTEKKRQECIKKFGYPMFEKLYSLLKKHRDLGTSDVIVRQEILKYVDKKEMNSCLAIDELIFLEFL